MTRIGAGRPGIAAVVTSTSNWGIRSCNAACCSACCSGVSSLAYPPSVSSPATPRSRKVAPSERTCSATAGLHVERRDDSAEPAGGRDRLQPRDSRADHEHLRRRDRAGRRRQHREEPRQAVGRDQHRLVARDRRLRGECVERLRPRDARDRFERESLHAGARERRERLGSRPAEEADQRLTRSEPRHLVRPSATRPWRRAPRSTGRRWSRRPSRYASSSKEALTPASVSTTTSTRREGARRSPERVRRDALRAPSPSERRDAWSDDATSPDGARDRHAYTHAPCP